MDCERFLTLLLDSGITAQQLGDLIGKRDPATIRKRLRQPLTLTLWEVLALALALDQAPLDLFPWLRYVPTATDVYGETATPKRAPQHHAARPKPVKIIIQDLRNGSTTHGTASHEVLTTFRDRLTPCSTVTDGHPHPKEMS